MTYSIKVADIGKYQHMYLCMYRPIGLNLLRDCPLIWAEINLTQSISRNFKKCEKQIVTFLQINRYINIINMVRCWDRSR